MSILSYYGIMKKLLPHFIYISMPLSALWGIQKGGYWVLTGFIFTFFVHPILDFIFGKTAHNENNDVKFGFIYDILALSYFPIQLFFFHFILTHVLMSSFPIWELLGISLSLGTISGAIGITLAHEFIHRRNPIERGIGISLLLMVNYAHFRIEHVYGHHKHVGTPRDPASARRGENLYRFWIRSIFGSWKSAWRIETQRVKNKSLFFNRVFLYLIAQILICTFIYLFYEKSSFLVFLIQSLVAIITLETVNFVEHYGLERKEISPGKYEPVSVLHSWDSRQKMTNWFLFNLGKHAHHHFSPNVPFEELVNNKNHRELKYGYSTHVVLAFFGIYPDPDQ
jgi:alkane 1-monooxygenase